MNPLNILPDLDSASIPPLPNTAPTKASKPFGLDLTLACWRKWMQTIGVSAFHAEQVMEWLFARHVMHPREWTNLPLKCREQAESDFSWELPHIDSRLTSTDGSEKLLLRLHDGLLTETVLMPSSGRITLCVSSQVGCRMGCTFCQTGKMGFSRNLSQGEILAQLVLANQILLEKEEGQRVSNVVFMGMGEPLENFDPVVSACQIMLHPRLFALSKHRVTVSTSGLIPEIERLGKAVPVALAISLHSADETVRSQLMPINKRYPLKELKQVLLDYPCDARYGITFEYVMINGVNDSIQQAKKLVSFVHGFKKVKVNLIPMNPHPGSDLGTTPPEAIEAFQKHLSTRGIPAPIRHSRGPDISGACGQLAAKRQEELQLDPRLIARARRAQARNAH